MVYCLLPRVDWSEPLVKQNSSLYSISPDLFDQPSGSSSGNSRYTTAVKTAGVILL
jgi:hypothetical protein